MDNKHSKKITGLIIMIVLFLLIMLIELVVIMIVLPSVIVSVVIIAVTAVSGGLLIKSLHDRIEEIRSGEEDDLSQY